MSPLTVSDLDAMSEKDLKEFLNISNSPYGATAEREELISQARNVITHQNAKDDLEKSKEKYMPKANIKKNVPKQIPDGMSDLDVYRMIQASGFKDANEMRSLFHVLEREKADISNQKLEIEAMHVELEKRENLMIEREKGVLKQAAEIHEDLKRQADIYEKIAAHRKALADADKVSL